MQKKMMIKHKSNRRLRNLIFLIIFSSIVYIIIYFIPKNYEFKYKIDNYTVVEKYLKNDKIYSFIVENQDEKYEFISDKKYIPDRKLLKKIKNYKNNNTSCIVIDSNILNNNIYCIKNNEMVDYHLTSIIPEKYIYKNDSKSIKYKDVKLNLIDNKTYFVWNYTGLYKINKETKETITIFKTDIYNINLNVIIDKYLVIADYDQQYNFNKFKIVNLENNKIDEINFDYEISFDSRILGTHKNSFYLIDNKNKKEYEINIKKKKVEVISNKEYGKLFNNNNFEKIKINKIISDNLKFNYNQNYWWNIENENLYLNQKGIKNNIKISNKKIKTLVNTKEDNCYYIVDDKLYKYSFKYGEEEILTYFELNFNYDDMIFIYE